MKIFVTGGSGFIGREVISQLLSSTDYDVINIDCLSYAGDFYSPIESVLDSSYMKRYLFEKVNICDLNNLRRLFIKHKPSYLIHLAAESHVDQSIESPTHFIQSNIVGTFNLLECVREYLQKEQSVSKSFRFLNVSTDEVFGDLNSDDQPFNESSNIKPSSPYSASKASADLLVDSWVRTYNLPCITTHCSNNYGHCQHPEKLIPFMIYQAIQRLPLTIYGNGENIRDWLHVSDHAAALITILFKGKPSRHYNIGANTERTNNQLVKLICQELQLIDQEHKRPNFDYQSLISYITDRKGHDLRYAIDSSRLTKELGWQAKIDFSEGFSQCVKWYVDYFMQQQSNGSAK